MELPSLAAWYGIRKLSGSEFQAMSCEQASGAEELISAPLTSAPERTAALDRTSGRHTCSGPGG